ncbi:MAG: response regulator [Deltaproteobacteria bacterium]|nr:response regulator [Deltaproteobacteria bacterium]
MLRVLVVDDDPVRSARWARALVARGHEVALAPDGERAIDRFVLEPADVCVISLVLPGRDGAATAESIRVAPGGDACAIVLLPGGVREVAMIERARVRASAAAVAPLGADADKVADLVEDAARARQAPARPLPKTRVAQEIEHGGGSGLGGPTRAPAAAAAGPSSGRGHRTAMLGGLDAQDDAAPSFSMPRAPDALSAARSREVASAAAGKPTAVVSAPTRRRETAVLAQADALPPTRYGERIDPSLLDRLAPSVETPHPAGDARIPPTRAGVAQKSGSARDDRIDIDVDIVDDEADVELPPTRAKRAAAATVAKRPGASEAERASDEPSAQRLPSAAFVMDNASLSVSTVLAGIDDPSAQREADEVERRSRAIARADDGRTGTLHDVPFPKLLAELGRERLTGALAVVHEDDGRRATGGDTIKKIVFFKAGVPIFVRSNVLSETLGHVLVRMGLLSPRQLEMSVDRMRRDGGRQGQILVSMGAITPHQLVTALQEQLRQKLFDIFAWSTGSYRFSSKVQPPPDVISLEMGLVETVFEGIVRKVHPTRVLTRLEPELERYAIPDTRRAERFLSLDLVTEARRVVSAMDGTQTIRQLLALAGNRPGAAGQVLYAMICVEAITLSKEPDRRARPQLPSGEQRLDASPEKPFDIETARDVFGRLAVLLRAGKPHEALGLPPDADRAEIEERLTRVMEAHKPELLPPSSPRDLRALAYQVMAQLMEAQQVLLGPSIPPPAPDPARDDDARTRAGDDVSPPSPSRALSAQGAGRDRAPAVTTDPIPRTPTGPRGIPVAPPPPPPPPPEPLASRAAEASVPLPPSSPSFDADVITVTPVRLHPREVARAAAAAEAAKVAPSTPPAGPALNDAVERIFEAEHHFRRGESALRRAKYEQAVDAIERAVALCPEEGEFLAYLGYVRYLAKPTDAAVVEKAIEDLQRATVSSPKLDRAHLFLGRVRAAQGDKRQARAAYQKALLANPDCREALEEMRRLDE